MKKIIFGALLGLSVVGSVYAADDAGTAIVGGEVIDATTDCTLLSESVTINLSKDVIGAYACNTTDNIIAVASCHPTGRKGSVTVTCVGNETSGACQGKAANAEVQVQGGLTYTASTAGGSVSGTNAAACTTTGGSTTTEALAAAQPPAAVAP